MRISRQSDKTATKNKQRLLIMFKTAQKVSNQPKNVPPGKNYLHCPKSFPTGKNPYKSVQKF